MYNLYTLSFIIGFWWEKPECERKENETKQLWQYLCSTSSDSPCSEGSACRLAGGSACSSADGHLLLDPISPFPSFFCSDLSSACHRSFSHLSLRWGHIALLLPRGRHFRAWDHGGCLSLTREQWRLNRSDGGRGRGDPARWRHRPENQTAEVTNPRQGTYLRAIRFEQWKENPEVFNLMHSFKMCAPITYSKAKNVLESNLF